MYENMTFLALTDWNADGRGHNATFFVGIEEALPSNMLNGTVADLQADLRRMKTSLDETRGSASMVEAACRNILGSRYQWHILPVTEVLF